MASDVSGGGLVLGFLVYMWGGLLSPAVEASAASGESADVRSTTSEAGHNFDTTLLTGDSGFRVCKFIFGSSPCTNGNAVAGSLLWVANA